ncbi:wings apart-like protein regulation of heterochromatin-domain-containing protein [Entophlyctis helioformis]|nr:wings apart-like protein regulation of heterochromatin-domain-containing protein [Entophlyctis helioformis]
MLLDDLPGPGSAQTHSAPLKRIALLKPSSRPTPAVTAGSDLALAASGSLSGNASLPSLASSSLDAAESTFAFTPAQPIQRQGAADVNGRFLTMQSLPSTFDEDGVDESPAQPAGRPATLRSPSSIEKTPLARSMSSPTPSPAIGITRLRLGGPTLLRGTGAPQPRSRRRSNLLTFGQNRTVMQSMRSAPLSDSPTSAVGNSLASLVDENEEEDEAPASAKIDEGLSSSDDDAPKVRSIHELREAGESKRFRDEMSYFFESLEPSQAQRLRRFTAIELARKLNTAKFVNNLRAHACTKTVFDLLVGSDDPFLRLFVVYFLWVLSHDVRNIEPLFACPELASAVVQALVVPVDRDLLLTLPKAKADAAIVQDLQSIMATSPRVLAMGVQSSEISMFSLGLDILAELSMVRGHLSVSLQEQLHSARAVAVIANRTTDLAFQAATRGKTETSQLKKHLRILEFATVRRGGAVVSGTEAERLAESLLALMSSTFPAVLDGSPTQAELLALDLRVVLNLANSPDCRVAMDHTQWIAVLLDLLVKLQQQRSRVSGGDKNDPAAGRHFLSSTAKPATAPLFDHMLLCISLLTNLIELHSPCAQVLLDSQIRSGACTGGKACKRTCKCTTTRPALDVIMAILQEQLDDASDAADAFVLTAHLGALFASVLKQSQKAVQVSKAVRGATWDSLVAATADVLRDFIEFHERVAAEHVTLSESEDHGVAATRKSLLSLLACLDGLAAASSD